MKPIQQKTKVKICGITNEADALVAAQAGASYLGYILLYPASPRCITVAQAKAIIDRVRQVYPHVEHVGVFVDQPASEVQAMTDTLHLDVVQLHGEESNDYIKQLIAPAVWKTIELTSPAQLQRLHNPSASSAILLDSGKGSGQTISSALLDQVDFSQPIILAGGITPDNVQAIVEHYHPMIIDVNSGVESAPGKKDELKIATLFETLTHLIRNNPTLDVCGL